MRPEQYHPDLPMLQQIRLPEGWLWGAGQSAYQTEGGINTGGGGPRDNWFDWEAERRVEPTGAACGFGDQPELVLDRVTAAASCASPRPMPGAGAWRGLPPDRHRMGLERPR